jgi:hypothetical protein
VVDGVEFSVSVRYSRLSSAPECIGVQGPHYRWFTSYEEGETRTTKKLFTGRALHTYICLWHRFCISLHT